MKYVLAIMTFYVWSFTAIASDTTIVFRQIKYADLFEIAKIENKGVMLYFHFDGCGACVNMERTAFKDQNVINYYNKNFVNFEINTLKGDGIEIELNNNYANNDTYAWLLYKSGNEKKAIKQANKSIEIAKKFNQDFSETQKLIDTTRKKK